jgi:glutathione-specific gamma-glutamylcyclotransferase
MSSQGLWVFGYGSLCWDPGFDFEQAHIGYIKGFRRTFSQGNTHHRGTKEKVNLMALIIARHETRTGRSSSDLNRLINSK